MIENKQKFLAFLNSFFDHIYLMTIERATDRHQFIEKELKGLNYSLFWGADHKNFSISDLIEKGVFSHDLARKNHRFSKPLKGGMLGCSLSHKMAYEDIIRNNYRQVLILEDDVVIENFSFENFEAAIRELPENWELLYFDYNRNERKPWMGSIKQLIYHIQKKLGFMKLTHKTIANIYAKKYSKNLLEAGFHDFTDAYAVTYNGAVKLLDLQTPVQWSPDNLLAYACSNRIINGFCLNKKTFSQTSQTNNPEQSLISNTSY